jgi:hypothetical protein
VGIEDLSRRERTALVSEVQWIRDAVSGFGFLLLGHLKIYYPNEEPAARAWIATN